MHNLPLPHGGVLKNLYLYQEDSEELSKNIPHFVLNKRQICDLELLLNGAFSPLDGFMLKKDYISVLTNMRLDNGTIWPIPINLDVTENFANSIKTGSYIKLVNEEHIILALLLVQDIWKPDKNFEAQCVFDTNDSDHPGVKYLMDVVNPIYLGGKLFGMKHFIHRDFIDLRNSPEDLRKIFVKNNWRNVVAFQTRNPMHRAHYELTVKAIERYNTKLLIHPVIGVTKQGDIDCYTRVRCYKSILKYYQNFDVILSLLPLAMRMAGPREALWHSIIRKNYGCSHFIVGRDHAGPGKKSNGLNFYEPYAARELVRKFEKELNITVVPFDEMVYVPNEDKYKFINEINNESDKLSISGTELRNRMQKGENLPEWFSFPEVLKHLQKSYVPKHLKGFTIFFTGLSGSGKSTIANILLSKLMECTEKSVSLLDGDIIRSILSSELTFSKEHRDLNIMRLGYVASEIVKHNGIAICASIAPYSDARKKVKEMVIANNGEFVEIYLNTPLEICEKRDVKGLYHLAKSGIIEKFTGISDPYEIPSNPDLIISTEKTDVSENIDYILSHLYDRGLFLDNLCKKQ